jgi:protein-L-isoaspartate(D-aspartate) O-methyltransferase
LSATTRPYAGITRIRFGGSFSPRGACRKDPSREVPTLIELWDNFKLRHSTPEFEKAMTPQMDFERARFNMVEQQIRPWEVLDQRVLDLLFRLRREDFVPENHRTLAFADLEIPIGHGERMLAPRVEARMLQALAITENDRILEVGTGSGYMTALLASVGGHVYSVDIVPEFARTAGEKLAAHGIRNVTLDVGDASRGWDKHGPYDAIVLTGSVPILPESFKTSLKAGGRLLAVVGEAPVMEAELITSVSAGAYNTVALFETCIASLRNAVTPERFVF